MGKKIVVHTLPVLTGHGYGEWVWIGNGRFKHDEPSATGVPSERHGGRLPEPAHAAGVHPRHWRGPLARPRRLHHPGHHVPVRALGPLLAVGFVAFLVSLPSFIGVRYHISWVLWLYLATLLLVLALLGATAFGLTVTAGGGGTQVMGRPYREYHTRDYSTWLQKHVADEKYWRPALECVARFRACREVAGWTPEDYMRRDLTPLQPGPPC
ncbi:hypothetical protein ACQ4PT_010965 [Festuca glaucescens]